MNKMKTLTLQGVTFEVVDEQARASIPEKIVQAVNGVEPDENGNVTIEISGGVTTVNGVAPDENGNVEVQAGVSPEEVTTIVKEQFPGGVGYEEVTETYGDTLTWDGNTEGLAKVELGEWTILYKISDATPSLSDVSNGGSYVDYDGKTRTFGGDQPMEVEGFVNFTGKLISVAENVVGVPCPFIEGEVFPEAGLYNMNGAISSVTINGYNGFKTTKVVTKKLDAKYLPESHQFGEEITETYGDTLTWDGNTEGLTCVDVGIGGLYLVSDSVPTQSECIGNVWCEHERSGEQYEGHTARLGESFSEDGFLADQEWGIFIVPNDNYTSSDLGVTFPKKGTYFASLYGNGESIRAISLTIEGYTDFKTVTTIVRKLDEKYLPDGVGGGIKYVTILEDDNGNYTASATYDEITNWIVGGVEVKCVLYGLMLSLTYSDVLRDISLMGAAARIHMFTCVDLHLLSSSPKCVEVRFEEHGGVLFYTHPLNAAQ